MLAQSFLLSLCKYFARNSINDGAEFIKRLCCDNSQRRATQVREAVKWWCNAALCDNNSVEHEKSKVSFYVQQIFWHSSSPFAFAILWRNDIVPNVSQASKHCCWEFTIWQRCIQNVWAKIRISCLIPPIRL